MKHQKCALVLQDQQLLAKLSAGDMIVQDVKYNLKCLVSLYNKAEAVQAKRTVPKRSTMALLWQSCWHTLMMPEWMKVYEYSSSQNLADSILLV